MNPAELPIRAVLPEVKAALRAQPLTILQAPPGAGKSTVLPLELLQEPWLAGQKIIMLQPRRVAARAVAQRLAQGLGEAMGQQVGYRVRFEAKVSPQTRLEVVTEGLLTRRLQSDPELRGVGLVLLDEFHERSLQADLALALLREVQEALRDDLRLLIMSATLDPSLPAHLGCPAIVSEGRPYPVTVRYQPSDPPRPVELVPALIRQALREHPGDLLAFLPGGREIRQVQEQLSAWEGITVRALYGELPWAQQQEALHPTLPGQRKVVLATNLAETSLTIPGVQIVIDSGLSRQPSFDASSGLSRLVTARISQDSATQRSGRAGRNGPGVAYRLWSERTQALLRPHRAPEVLDSELSGLLLELLQWGSRDPLGLPWLDPPPIARLDQARRLLRELGALDEAGQLTAAGRALLRFPTHPRLAHLLHQGHAQGRGALAADLAALLEERDPLGPQAGADLNLRISALRRWRQGHSVQAADLSALRRIERLAQQWRQRLGVEVDHSRPEATELGALVALAYPERVALSRSRTGGERGRYLLSSGFGASLHPDDLLGSEAALAVAHLDQGPQEQQRQEGRIFLAAPLDLAWLHQQAHWQDNVRWDSRAGALVAQQELRHGALVLGTRPLEQPQPAARLEALCSAIRREGLHLLTFSPTAQQLRARGQSLRQWQGGESWPDWSDEALLETLEDWLGPQLGSVRTRAELGRLDPFPALLARLEWPQQRELDELAPTHLTVPSGSRVRLEYHTDGSAPILAVKLQELFGLAQTPRVMNGEVSVLLHLLSPAGRPVQVTQDLAHFWNNSYFEVRKELRGRYPKHPWPDDPWQHAPTRGVKRRG